VNNASQNSSRGEEGYDRLCLVRPVIDIVMKQCLQNYLPREESSIDEAMVVYKGKLSFKQYLFGVKVWVRADPNNGYANEFDIYTGKNAESAVADDGGLGARVVKKLSEQLRGKNHHVYMDIFF